MRRLLARVSARRQAGGQKIAAGRRLPVDHLARDERARSRAQLTALMDRPVHLYLHVKVRPGWDEDREVYRDLGLDWVE